MDSPPGNKGAAPAKVAAGSVEEQQHTATTGTDPQAAATESAHLSIIKQWLRCDDQTRRELLRDIKFAHPELWREVTEEVV